MSTVSIIIVTAHINLTQLGFPALLNEAIAMVWLSNIIK